MTAGPAPPLGPAGAAEITRLRPDTPDRVQPVVTSGADLDGHARSAMTALDRIAPAAWSEAGRAGWLDLAELVGRVCAVQHGLEPLAPPPTGAPGHWHHESGERWQFLADLTAADRALLEFAAQFAVDVSAITDAQRGDLFDQWGRAAPTVAAVVFTMDVLPRARAALRALVPDLGEHPAPPDADPAGIWEAFDGLIRTVPRLDALDPVTSELVRLRGARQHRCRLCQSLRSRPAVQAGADEPFLSLLDDYEHSDLSLHQKAALAMTDAIIWTPGRMEAAVRRLAALASPEQCVELVADVTRNALNKIAVSLAADAPHVEEGIEIYDVDADGEIVYGLTID